MRTERKDTIADFLDGLDRIDLRGLSTFDSFDALMSGTAAHDVPGGVAKGDQLIVKGISLHDLSASDFLF